MLQEQIPGGDDSPVDGRKLRRSPAAACPASSAAASCSRRRPGSARAGSGVAEWDDEAVDGARRLLHALGFHGISQVEYKRDPRDGTLRLMEVNARLWQWHSLAAACGVDLVQMAYRDAIGEPVTARTSRGAGRRRWVARRPPRAREPPRAAGAAPHAGAAPPAVHRARVLAARPDARRPPAGGRPPLVAEKSGSSHPVFQPGGPRPTRSRGRGAARGCRPPRRRSRRRRRRRTTGPATLTASSAGARIASIGGSRPSLERPCRRRTVAASWVISLPSGSVPGRMPGPAAAMMPVTPWWPE